MVTRAEHRRATLLRLSAAATEAFGQIGFTATLADIADRAGVSRRTVFRYVTKKEDLAFIHPILWFDLFDTAVAEVADHPLTERILHASRRISENIDADPTPVIEAMEIALATPELARGYAAVSQRWKDRIAQEILVDTNDPHSPFRAKILGAAVMGVIDAALAEWLASSPRPPLVDVVEKGLKYVQPILEAKK